MIKNKEELAEKISDSIVDSMDVKELKTIVWDVTYTEMIEKSWEDLYMFAEEYSPHLITPITY